MAFGHWGPDDDQPIYVCVICKRDTTSRDEFLELYQDGETFVCSQACLGRCDEEHYQEILEGYWPEEEWILEVVR